MTPERYLERCRLKTASLFAASCRLGALFGGRPAMAEALGRFGECVGLAFQMLDDVLDVSGPPERTGKPRGTDLLDGTVTLPLILARASATPRSAELSAELTAEQAESVCDRIAATGALDGGARSGAHARGGGKAVTGPARSAGAAARGVGAGRRRRGGAVRLIKAGRTKADGIKGEGWKPEA